MISWWQEERKFRFQRRCCDVPQPSSRCSSPLSELWLVFSVLTQVLVVLVDSEVCAYLPLHPQPGLSAVEPSAPLQGTCPGGCQFPPSVNHLHSSTQHHIDASTNPPFPTTIPPGIEGDGRVLTQGLFASLATWHFRVWWDFPASWLPPRVPNENAHWPFVFDFP